MFFTTPTHAVWRARPVPRHGGPARGRRAHVRPLLLRLQHGQEDLLQGGLLPEPGPRAHCPGRRHVSRIHDPDPRAGRAGKMPAAGADHKDVRGAHGCGQVLVQDGRTGQRQQGFLRYFLARWVSRVVCVWCDIVFF